MNTNHVHFPLLKIEESIHSFLKTADDNGTADLSLPPYKEHGDLTTNISLRLSKKLGKSPKDVATEICNHLEKTCADVIDRTEIAGPGFVNIFLSNTARSQILNAAIAQSTDMFHLNTDQGVKWVIEHTSPNPNKAMHLGHLRNNFVGMSLANLIEACSGTVVRDAVDNNRGIAIAKAMYGFLALMKKDESIPTTTAAWIENNANWYTPKEKSMRGDVFVTYCYTGGESLLKEDKTIETVVRQMVVDWENKDANTWKLWQHILDYSYTGMQMTLERLGNKWDKIWHEHEHYEKGKQYVEQGLQKGVFKKLDDGAVLTQIEETYDIPETILLKNDGTALYITQDIALTDLKKKAYNADKLVWVIGPEQSLAMRQLFAVCEQLGIGKLSDFIHISYGYMGLKDSDGNFKKMSSRAGTVLLIDELLDTVKEKILDARGEEINNDQAEKIAMAAVKFSILKCEKNLNMAFSIDESVNLNGDSGVYVLYTYARIQSILREREKRGIKNAVVIGNIAPEISRLLGTYPLTLQSARKHLSVHPIAHYLLALCATFNKFYGEEKILDDSESMPEKLAILEAVNKTIANGLGILGIETVDKM